MQRYHWLWIALWSKGSLDSSQHFWHALIVTGWSVVLYQNHYHLSLVAFVHCNANWQGILHISSHCSLSSKREWIEKPKLCNESKSDLLHSWGMFVPGLHLPIYQSKWVIKGNNGTDVCRSLFYLLCISCWYVRKVCSALSMSKYW